MRKIKKTAGYYARKLRVKMIKSASDGLSVKAYGRGVWNKSQSYISKNGYNHYDSIKDNGTALAKAVEKDRNKQWKIHGDYQKNMQLMFRSIKVDNSAQPGRDLVYLYTPGNARLSAGYKDLVSRWNFSKTSANEMVEDDVKVSILNSNKTHNFLAGSGGGFIGAVTSSAGKGDIDITANARAYMLICKNLLEEWESLLDKWAEGEDAWRIYRKKNPGNNPVGKNKWVADKRITSNKSFKNAIPHEQESGVSVWVDENTSKLYVNAPRIGQHYIEIPSDYTLSQLADNEQIMFEVAGKRIRILEVETGKYIEFTNSSAGWQGVK